ncbi:MAG: ankyrin repeat protein [bacterium]|jgi:ankyrin repeat protein
MSKKQIKVQFPFSAEILHHIVKSLDMEGTVKEKLSESLKIDAKTIERFWKGENPKEDQTTAKIYEGHINVIYQEFVGEKIETPTELVKKFMGNDGTGVISRYDLMTTKVYTYNVSEQTLLWSLSSRFFIPFFANVWLYIESKLNEDFSDQIINLLEQPKPIQTVFHKFCKVLGFETKTSIILSELLLLEKNINYVDSDPLRKRLERLNKGERFNLEYLETLLDDMILSKENKSENVSKWISLFRIASAISYFIKLSENTFEKKNTAHLIEFFATIVNSIKNQNQDLETTKQIELSPYFMGLKVPKDGTSSLYNMMDWDLYHHGEKGNLWKLPESNYDWVLWKDDEYTLSKVFIKFFEELSNKSISKIFLEEKKEELSSNYLSLIQKLEKEPNFSSSFETALYAERLHDTGKANEFLKLAYTQAETNTEKFWSLLFQLHCYCDLQRKKEEGEEILAKKIIQELKEIKNLENELYEKHEYIIAFYEARFFVLNNQLKKAAKQYDNALKLAKNLGGIVYKKIVEEGVFVASKAGGNTIRSFTNLYKEGYRKVIFTYPYSEVEDYIFEHMRKQFYSCFPEEVFYQNVSQKKIQQESSNLKGLVQFSEEQMEKWLDPKSPNRKITDGVTRCSYPLILASELGEMESLLTLIKSGADINSLNSNNESALLFACFHKNPEMAQAILDTEKVKIETINQRSKKKRNSPFSAAVESCHVDLVKRFIKMGADLNQRVTAENGTLLYYAINQIVNAGRWKNYDIINTELNPEVIHQQNFARSFSDLLLQPQVKENLDQVWKIKQQFQKDPNKKKFMKEVSKYYASKINVDACYKTAKILIEAGADLEIKHKANHTALTFAGEIKDERLVTWLIQFGADIHAVTDQGSNVLDHLIEPSHSNHERLKNPFPFGVDQENVKEHPQLVQILIDAGIDIEMVGAGHLTPLELARLSNQKEVIKVLQKNSKKQFKSPQELFEEAVQYEKKEGYTYKSIATYLEAIEKGHISSILHVADCYARFKACHKKSEKMYGLYIEKVNEPEKQGNAFIKKGVLFCKVESFKKAEECFFKAKNLGNVKEAYQKLGYLHCQCLKQNRTAIKFYEKALEVVDGKTLDIEDINTLNDLGVLYLEEINSPQQAAKMWMKASGLGSADAMMNMGYLFENYFRDLQKAQQMYLMAKSHNHPEANNRLQNLSLKSRT